MDIESELNEFKKRIADIQLDFAGERQVLSTRIQKLEADLKFEREQLYTTQNKFNEVKEGLYLATELNTEHKKEISSSKNHAVLIETLKAEIEMEKRNNSQLQLNYDNLLIERDTLRVKIKQLEVQLVRDESHVDILKTEISQLMQTISELEERFTRERVAGTGHIGLSKIDFQPQQNLYSVKMADDFISKFDSYRPTNKESTNQDLDTSVVVAREVKGNKYSEQIPEVSQKWETSSYMNSKSKFAQSKTQKQIEADFNESVDISRFSLRSIIRNSYLQGNNFIILVGLHNLSIFMDQGSVEHFQMSKDYLNISYSKEIVGLIVQNGGDEPNGQCLSDFIYVVNGNERKRRKIIILAQGIFIINAGKSPKLIIYYPLEQINQAVLSAQNVTLACFTFNASKFPSLLIDTYRRLEILLYISKLARKSKLDSFKVIYLRKIRPHIIQKNKDIVLDFGKKQKQLPILQETIRNSQKSGLLKLRTNGFFGKVFREYFFILSNLGLIYYRTYGVSLT